MVSEHQILYIYIETLRQDFSVKLTLLIIIYPKNTFQEDTMFSQFRNSVPSDMHSIFLAVSNQRMFAYHYFTL